MCRQMARTRRMRYVPTPHRRGIRPAHHAFLQQGSQPIQWAVWRVIVETLTSPPPGGEDCRGVPRSPHSSRDEFLFSPGLRLRPKPRASDVASTSHCRESGPGLTVGVEAFVHIPQRLRRLIRPINAAISLAPSTSARWVTSNRTSIGRSADRRYSCRG